ncbi:23S rRNA (guanosine(2251)-2'-O)-methyltransferase RlmB [Candidatus Riesia pediculischaeffi]|uniref:Putative RNA methyltransferase, TrmH family protein n=1 Tax=Candidatus Riesia pediculischaeffi PTSU TaxID=1401651 RepID=A0A0C1S9A1_9ENTR|nr:23S rRNA (guanosine(2251)-2'-O)-methyltransferase RlmB [Candidatus Riesia pediculischaeffi]KIE63821.1 putative RNA methyltransferase, TrmH family protein [Candidatus Riesia pediculischaeffi PTSU]
MKKIICGIHTIESYLMDRDVSFKIVYISENSKNDRIFNIKRTLRSRNITVLPVRRKHLNQISSSTSHQGVVAVIDHIKRKNSKSEVDEVSLKKSSLFLILDRITDVRNLGSCLRTAYFFGVDAVVVPRYRSAKLNSTVEKVSCGASKDILFIRTDLQRFVKNMIRNDVKILGADERSDQDIYNYKFDEKKMAIIIGNEGRGIRDSIKKNCCDLVKVPSQKRITSLNVSVIAGIFLFEVTRQRSIILHRSP